jgi:hypothetical protein
MQIAAAVAGIERLRRRRDQKIALSGMAGAFASGRVAHAVDPVQGMRNVIAKRRLLQHSLAVS